MCSKDKRRQRAFTIIEVMTAVALISLLMGGLMAIVQAGMRATTELTAIQRRSQEFMGLHTLMNETFRNLSSDVALESRETTEAGGEKVQQVVLYKATGTLDYGVDELNAPDIVITTRRQPNGLRMLTLYYLDSEVNQDQAFDLSKAVKALDLVPDLAVKDGNGQAVPAISWRFYQQQANQWFDGWRAGGPRPDLIEMNVTGAEDAEPRRFVFWLPKVTSTATAGNPAAPEGNPGGGGGGGGNGGGNGGNGGGRGEGNGGPGNGGGRPRTPRSPGQGNGQNPPPLRMDRN